MSRYLQIVLVALLAFMGGCGAYINPTTGGGTLGFSRGVPQTRPPAEAVGYIEPRSVPCQGPACVYAVTEPVGSRLQTARVNINTEGMAVAVRYRAQWAQIDIGQTMSVTDEFGGRQSVPVILPMTIAGRGELPIRVVFQDRVTDAKQIEVFCIEPRRSANGNYGEVIGQAILVIRYGDQGYGTWEHGVWNYSCTSGRRQ